ncbi:MAG: lysophospholipid acyltransferase family protein [Verrucomicrobiota bacterium]
MSLRHRLEYVGVRFVLLLSDLLPLSVSGWVVRRLADAWFFFDRSRRRVAQENIRRAGVAEEASVVRGLARDSFRHFGMLLLESVQSGRVYTEENWREKIDLDFHPEAQKLLDDPKQGVLLVSGHIGNWEIAAQLVSFIKPVHGVTRPMNNPLVEKLVLERKPKNKFRITPKYDANALRFLSFLKQGDVLALLTDQHARSHGMWVDFFGVPASTHTTPAMLHLVTKTPICFGVCIRTGPMTYRFSANEPIRIQSSGDREQDVKTILEAINAQLEKEIRAHPEQYLWAHRRWRTPKPDG